MTGNSKARYRTAFGRALGQQLAARGMTFADGAKNLGVTAAYVSKLTAGTTHPSPGWLDLIATSLSLTEEERVGLHRAAAQDKGYKLDLSK
jgi:transcriptional regulator with XRE-family HTH domain